MKVYFRLLSFANPLHKYVVPYFILSLLSILFGLLNYTLLIPIFNLLFSEGSKEPIKVLTTAPQFYYSLDYFKDLFYYLFYEILKNWGKLGALEFVSFVIFLSVLLANGFRYFSQIVLEDLRIHTLLNLRRAVFNKVTNLHIGFFSNERKGEIMSKISTDVLVVQGSVTSSLLIFFKEPLTIIIYFFVLFKLSFQLTIFTIFFIPISGLIIAFIVRKLRQITSDAQTSLGVMLTVIDETLTGLKVIKAFNAIKYTQDKFHSENIKYSDVSRKIIKKNEMASPMSELLGVLVVIGILIYGGSMVLSGHNTLKPEEFITYVAIFSQVLRPAKAITSSFTVIQHGIIAGERVLELIDTKSLIENKPNAIEAKDFNNEVEFKNISFSYGHKTVLHNVSFTIPKGKTIALVGPSGGGKSTISDLIPRFYDPNEGQILFDGIDIRDYTMESLRNQMGIVNQEPILFNDTIFNNIAFNKENVTEQEVINAAKVANAHDFIMASENGYQNVIGDRGVKLSGGQKQRISIARAVLMNPPILILDEATSALDTESEKLVQEALNNLMKNRTSLVIAHRLSTIQGADEIIVIDDGRIIERGNHEILLTNYHGVYKKLKTLQTL